MQIMHRSLCESPHGGGGVIVNITSGVCHEPMPLDLICCAVFVVTISRHVGGIDETMSEPGECE